MFGIYDINKNSNLTYKERINVYKQVGFQEMALYLDEKYNRDEEDYLDIIKYARNNGLSIKQVHIDYKISNLICDKTTNEYFQYISNKLKEASDVGIPFVVAHASMSDNPPQIDEVQIEKFVKMMKGLENLNVTLCLENVRNNFNLEILLNLNLPDVKMCFDLGHAHCYSNEKELFNKFKDKIYCSHLHNNFGKDSHFTLDNGEIECDYFIKELQQLNNSSNCLECFPEKGKILTRVEFIDFVQKCYDSIKI